jgi:hypothetical protein
MLRAANVDVVDRQIHAVASHLCAEVFNRGEDGGHSRLVLDLLEQLFADQNGRCAGTLEDWCIQRYSTAYLNHAVVDAASKESRISL